jgi:hypothetical protein
MLKFAWDASRRDSKLPEPCFLKDLRTVVTTGCTSETLRTLDIDETAHVAILNIVFVEQGRLIPAEHGLGNLKSSQLQAWPISLRAV